VARLKSPVFLLAILALLPACATRAPAGPGNPEVTIHESVTSAPPRHEIVKRLWAASASSAFGTWGYASREDAMADFRDQAASLGGNGVINFGCYRLVDSERLVCNGTIVRFL